MMRGYSKLKDQNSLVRITNLLSEISSELYVIQEKKNFLQSRYDEKATLISDLRKNEGISSNEKNGLDKFEKEFKKDQSKNESKK